MKHPQLIVYINGKNDSHRHFIQTGPSEHRETGGYPLYTLRELSTQQLTESRPYQCKIWHNHFTESYLHLKKKA